MFRNTASKHQWYHTGLFDCPAGILLLVCIISSALLNPAPAQELADAIPLHHFELPCDSCHSPGATASDVSRKPQAFWRIADDVDQLCTISGCHYLNCTLWPSRY